MNSLGATALLQTATPTPGVGPAELADYWPAIIRAGWFLAGFLIVILIGWVIVEPAISRVIYRRNRENPTVRETISQYIRVVILVLAVFTGAGVAGYGQFLTNSALIIAAGTLAIGVAGQTVIGSLISGLVLVWDPEFNIGNYIEWETGEGTVQSITLRVTRVLSPDGELITIPNTVLTEQAITRPYGRHRYRIVEHVRLAYEDDIDEAMRHLREAAETLDSILDDPEPHVYVEKFGDDAVILQTQYWIEDPRNRDMLSVRSKYAREVKSRLDAADITISPPSQRDLQGRIEIQDLDPQR